METRPEENVRRKGQRGLAGRADTSEPSHMENRSDKPYYRDSRHIRNVRSNDIVRKSYVTDGLCRNGTERDSDMVACKGISPAMVAVDCSRPYEYDTLRDAGIVVDDSIVRAVHIISCLRIPSLETKRKIYLKRKGSPIGEPFIYEVVPKDFAS